MNSQTLKPTSQRLPLARNADACRLWTSREACVHGVFEAGLLMANRWKNHRNLIQTTRHCLRLGAHEAGEIARGGKGYVMRQTQINWLVAVKVRIVSGAGVNGFCGSIPD